MYNLPIRFPEIYQSFLNGNFSAQLSSINHFGRNDADKSIENTINHDTKTPGGIKGFSLTAPARTRWGFKCSAKSNISSYIAQSSKFETIKVCAWGFTSWSNQTK